MRAVWLAALLAASSTCSIICGAACEFIPPGACLGLGGMFGRCDDGVCASGLLCADRDTGTICLPPAGDAMDDDVQECASLRGTMSCDRSLCFFGCRNDSECEHGLICDEESQMCVHANSMDDIVPQHGWTLGPCFAQGQCDDPEEDCHADPSIEGGICIHPDNEEWLVPCTKTGSDECPNGQICSEGFGHCVWPW